MSEILIRTARPGDLAGLAEIYRLASLSNEGDRDLLLAHPGHLELDGEAVTGRRARLAEIDGRPVGFASGTPTGAVIELEDLFVHPDWMRRGVATRLVTDLVDRARLAGIARVEVTANHHAMAFYRRVGFRVTGPIETTLGSGLRMYLPVTGTGPEG